MYRHIFLGILVATMAIGIWRAQGARDLEPALDDPVESLIYKKMFAAAEIQRIIATFSWYQLTPEELDEVYTCMLERPFQRMSATKETMKKLKDEDGVKSCFRRDTFSWYLSPTRAAAFFQNDVAPIEVRAAAPRIGYLKITRWSHVISIATDTGPLYSDIFMDADLKPALVIFAEKGIDALIVDIRGNPGGSVENAIRFLKFFAPWKDMPMMTIRSPEKTEELATTAAGPYASWKVVFLIDRDSASASEIVAGIGQWWGMPVIGQPSYGKDLIQQVFRLSDGGFFQLTVSRFVLPHGESLEGKGIIPDIPVKGDALRAALRFLQKEQKMDKARKR